MDQASLAAKIRQGHDLITQGDTEQGLSVLQEVLESPNCPDPMRDTILTLMRQYDEDDEWEDEEEDEEEGYDLDDDESGDDEEEEDDDDDDEEDDDDDDDDDEEEDDDDDDDEELDEPDDDEEEDDEEEDYRMTQGAEQGFEPVEAKPALAQPQPSANGDSAGRQAATSESGGSRRRGRRQDDARRDRLTRDLTRLPSVLVTVTNEAGVVDQTRHFATKPQARLYLKTLIEEGVLERHIGLYEHEPITISVRRKISL